MEIDVWDGEERDLDKEQQRQHEKERKKEASEQGYRGLRDRIGDKLHGGSSSHGKEVFRQPERWTSASTQMRREPRVLHGYTLTKDVPFREVCEAIRDAAFVNRYVSACVLEFLIIDEVFSF